VKDNAQNTQRVAKHFVKQVGDRIKERVYLSKAEDSIMHDLCDSLQGLSVTSNPRNRLLDSDIICMNSERCCEHTFTVGHPAGSYDLEIKIQPGDTETNIKNGSFKHSTKFHYWTKEKQDLGNDVCPELRQFYARTCLVSGVTEHVFVGHTEAVVKLADFDTNTILRCSDSYRIVLCF
jgi:hypothetical protein